MPSTKAPKQSLLKKSCKLKFKKLCSRAVIPSYAKPGDAGLDLTATDALELKHGQWTYATGLAVEIPEGYVGLLFPRSSVYKMDLALSNCVGVIDSGYRGELMFKFNMTKPGGSIYAVGDRVGQLVLMRLPRVEIEEVTELSDTARGTGGFGSSGT